MDIEITIRVGERSVKDDGTVKFKNLGDDYYLVTYFENKDSAKTEALRSVKEMLNKLLD